MADTVRQDWGKLHVHVVRIIRATTFRAEIKEDAVSLAWDSWHSCKEDIDVGPSHWAWLGIRRALCSRNLTGMERQSSSDPFRRLTKWSCGGMGDLADRRPGPDVQVDVSERYTMFLSLLTERQREAAELLAAGYTTLAAAKELRCTPGAVSQMRRVLLDVWQSIE